MASVDPGEAFWILTFAKYTWHAPRWWSPTSSAGGRPHVSLGPGSGAGKRSPDGAPHQGGQTTKKGKTVVHGVESIVPAFDSIKVASTVHKGHGVSL